MADRRRLPDLPAVVRRRLGDGVGDLEGIRRHLDHLTWLGVDAIWLSPFFRSPMADFGYDVADYCDVDPLFGDLADFDALVAEAHARGIRVIVDWVPNHTSDQHPWFRVPHAGQPEARLVHLARPGTRRRPAEQLDRRVHGESRRGRSTRPTGQWYLHLFLPEQPDLNWRNPEVVAAMHDMLRFWLDRGRRRVPHRRRPRPRSNGPTSPTATKGPRSCRARSASTSRPPTTSSAGCGRCSTSTRATG